MILLTAKFGSSGGKLNWSNLHFICMGLIWIDDNSIRKTNARLSLALSNGISKADAEEGQVIVMEIHDDSSLSPIVGHAFLRINRGEGGFVWRVHTVKESNPISLTLGDAVEYVDAKDFRSLRLNIIMPVVSFLVLLEYGAQPWETITWKDGTTEETTSVEDLFLQGRYWPLVDTVESILPNGINTINAIMSRLGLLSTPQGPPSLNLLEVEKVYPFKMLDWINQLAIGEGLSNVFQPETDNPSGPRKSIKILQELLKRCGVEAMSKAEGDGETPVSGYSYVSMPDNNHYRHIAFCGYFPADKPKYGIIIWLKKEEDTEELKDKNRPELGVYAASVCKRIVEYMIDSETKNLQKGEAENRIE